MTILIITAGDIIVPEVPPARLEQIGAAAPGLPFVVATTRQEALAAAPAARIVFGLVDPELYALMPRLEWIQATTSGVDFLLFPPLATNAVAIACEKGSVGSHLADQAMALLLAHARQVGEAARLGAGAWARRVELRRQRMFELEGLTLAIVGFGGTGRALARRAAGFGMRLLALDAYPVPGSAEVPAVEPFERLDAVLGKADVVALCCPLTPATQRLFDDARFARMKPGAVLLNVTRGEVVDTEALLRALQSGRLGGAGLDVLDPEPLPAEHPLWHQWNCLITPHIAGASQLRAGRNIDRFIENLGRWQRGEPLVGLVDKALGY